MNRRETVFAILALGAAGATSRAPAQTHSRKVHRIGFLGTAFASGYVRELEWIRNGLRKYGYVEGGNLIIEYRWAEGNPQRVTAIAEEFAALKVDAILVHGLPGAIAAANVTSAIPIVMADGADPVAGGIAASLARPGRNVTGSTSFVTEELAKRLQLLLELAPRARSVGFLATPMNPPTFPIARKALNDAAASMKVELREFVIREAAELPATFNAMTKAGIDAAVINNEPLLNSHAGAIAALAAAMRLPAVGYASFADAGGLLAYGANRPALYGRAGYFLDRIFKGAKPGDIPFERAARFDLIANAKAARELGIAIPQSILLRADRVIE